LFAEGNLQWGYATTQNGGDVYIVYEPNEYFGVNAIVEEYEVLRPVNDYEVYISNEVAFAFYDGCQHNVFFEYYDDFYPPSICPVLVGGAGYLDEDSVNLP
jgi:hypothetical protein